MRTPCRFRRGGRLRRCQQPASCAQATCPPMKPTESSAPLAAVLLGFARSVHHREHLLVGERLAVAPAVTLAEFVGDRGVDHRVDLSVGVRAPTRAAVVSAAGLCPPAGTGSRARLSRAVLVAHTLASVHRRCPRLIVGRLSHAVRRKSARSPQTIASSQSPSTASPQVSRHNHQHSTTTDHPRPMSGLRAGSSAAPRRTSVRSATVTSGSPRRWS